MFYNSFIDTPFVHTKMRQNPEILQIRISSEMMYYLEIIRDKYKIKRCEFVRCAILEKLKRDVPKMRAKKEFCPF